MYQNTTTSVKNYSDYRIDSFSYSSETGLAIGHSKIWADSLEEAREIAQIEARNKGRAFIMRHVFEGKYDVLEAVEADNTDRYELRVFSLDEDTLEAEATIETNAHGNAENAISVASLRVVEAAEAGDSIKAIVVDTDTDEVLFSDTTLSHRFTVAAYCPEEDSEADTDIIEENTYSTQEEAINVAKERIREAEEDNEAIRVVVYATAYEDEPLYEADSTGTAYRLFLDYCSETDGAVVYSAEEAAQAFNDYLCDSDAGTEAYDDMLDECNEMVTIGSLSYYPSIALERIDPVAYRCGLSDWADSEYKAALYDIERMEYGDIVGFYGWNCKLVHIAEEIDYTADNSKWETCR